MLQDQRGVGVLQSGTLALGHVPEEEVVALVGQPPHHLARRLDDADAALHDPVDLIGAAAVHRDRERLAAGLRLHGGQLR